MAFCSKCGAQYEGQFCAACGAPTVGANAAGAGLTTNMASTLCYGLFIIGGIVFLVLAPYNANKTVRFHAFQSIFVGLAMIALNITLSVALPVLTYLMISPVISLASLGLWIFMLVKTYQGNKVVLPVVGPLAEQQA